MDSTCDRDRWSTICRWKSLANFSSSLAAYEVMASRLWAEIQVGTWTVDLVRARVTRFNKYFVDGTKPARTSTSRLVLGDIDSHGSSSFDPPEGEEEEDNEVEEEEETEDGGGDDDDDGDDADDEIQPG